MYNDLLQYLTTMYMYFVQVCKEKKVKQIKPNYDTSVINKRSTKAIADQDIITPNTLTGHCGLPERDEEFSTFIFVYSETTNLDKIIKSVKAAKNSARVLLAKPIEHIHMIIFEMNRAAYLQVIKSQIFQALNHITVTQEQNYISVK